MVNLKIYPILKACRTKTKFGESIQIELENNILFLPNRYNTMTEEEIFVLSSGNYLIKKESGIDEKNFRLLLEEFEMQQYIIPQTVEYPTWK